MNVELWTPNLSASPLDMLVRLSLAAVMGAIVGWERERLDKPAGLRTHMMVSLGAATFTLATLQLFLLVEGEPQGRSDPVRLVEGVIGGIGFLGAGQIIQSRGSVQGVTTAAGIWVVGAVGIACGIGHYALAAMTVGLSVIILAMVRLLQRDSNRREDND